MKVLVTFTFNPSRESNYDQAVELFKKHFPGVYRMNVSHRSINQQGVRVTCTADEFCLWIAARDAWGFVNRMHQLDMHTVVKYDERPGIQRKRYADVIRPFEYTTPMANV